MEQERTGGPDKTSEPTPSSLTQGIEEVVYSADVLGGFIPTIHGRESVVTERPETLSRNEAEFLAKRFSLLEIAMSLQDDIRKKHYAPSSLSAKKSPPLARSVAIDLLVRLGLERRVILEVDENEEIRRNPKRPEIDESVEKARKRVEGYSWRPNKMRRQDLKYSREEVLASLDDEINTAVESRDRLVTNNQALVAKIAAKYIGRGLSFDSLVQIGIGYMENGGQANRGLVHAVERFDWRRENRFSTYAVWWINLAMQLAIKKQERYLAKRVRLQTLDEVRAGEDDNGDTQQIAIVEPVAPSLVDETAKEFDIDLLTNVLQLAFLTDDERTILELRYRNSKDNKYIGKVTGLSITTIRRRHQTALDKLRAVIQDPMAARIRAELVQRELNEYLMAEMPTIIADRTLLARTRHLFELHAVEGKSLKETAEEMHLSQSLAKKLKSQEFTRLKKRTAMKTKASELASNISVSAVRTFVDGLPEMQRRVLTELFGNQRKGTELANELFIDKKGVSKIRRMAMNELAYLINHENPEQVLFQRTALRPAEVIDFLASEVSAFLTPRQREVFDLVFVQDLSLSQVAERLDVSRDWVSRVFVRTNSVVVSLLRNPERRAVEEQIAGLNPHTTLRALRALRYVPSRIAIALLRNTELNDRDRILVYDYVFSQDTETKIAEMHGLSTSQVDRILQAASLNVAHQAVVQGEVATLEQAPETKIVVLPSEVIAFLDSSLAPLITDRQQEILRMITLDGMTHTQVVEALHLTRDEVTYRFKQAQAILIRLRNPERRRIEEQIIDLRPGSIITTMRSLAAEKAVSMINALEVTGRDRSIIEDSVYLNLSSRVLAERHGLSKTQILTILANTAKDIARKAAEVGDNEFIEDVRTTQR